MALGDDRFAGATRDLMMLLELHGVPVTVTRYDDSQITAENSNIFGTPQGYQPENFTTAVLVANQYLDDESTEAGSKPKEHALFLCAAGTLKEHDQIAYNGHTFQVIDVNNAPMAVQDRLEMADSIRVVAP